MIGTNKKSIVYGEPRGVTSISEEFDVVQGEGRRREFLKSVELKFTDGSILTIEATMFTDLGDDTIRHPMLVMKTNR